MEQFKIITNENQIKLSSSWSDFQVHRTVEKNGKTYRIIGKERDLTKCEQGLRKLLGVILVILSLSFALKTPFVDQLLHGTKKIKLFGIEENKSTEETKQPINTTYIHIPKLGGMTIPPCFQSDQVITSKEQLYSQLFGSNASALLGSNKTSKESPKTATQQAQEAMELAKEHYDQAQQSREQESKELEQQQKKKAELRDEKLKRKQEELIFELAKLDLENKKMEKEIAKQMQALNAKVANLSPEAQEKIKPILEKMASK